MSADPQSGRASFQRFIGISLGGGRGKTTAVARLELREDDTYVLEEARVKGEHRGGGPGDSKPGSFRDAVLLDYLERFVDEGTVVAVDAPLTLPPCMRCQLPCPGVEVCEVPVVAWMRRHGEALSVHRGRRDPGKPYVTPYTQRATEILLEHATLQPREALGQGMGPLAARGVYLRRVLSPRVRLHENLIEVHPRATLTRLFGRERERTTRHGDLESVWGLRKSVLHELVHPLRFRQVWPELVVRNANVFYAVISAISAARWRTHGWTGPQDLVGEGAPSPTDAVRADVEASSSRRVREPTGDVVRMSAAIEELGELWREDGWIWTPPVGSPP